MAVKTVSILLCQVECCTSAWNRQRQPLPRPTCALPEHPGKPGIRPCLIYGRAGPDICR